MEYEVFVSVIGALATVFAALASQYIFRRQRDIQRRKSEEITQLADLVRTEESKSRAGSVERLLEKIPSGLQLDEFNRKLEEIAVTFSQAIPTRTESYDAVENLINGYHEQALDQAKVQFWFSVVAASIGFTLIIYQGMNIDIDQLSTTAKILPGATIDAVAFLFFRQASATRQRATELYDRLRTDKKNSESVRLVSSIEDLRVRSAVKAQIALHMSGLNPSAIDLTKFLSPEDAGKSSEDDAEEERVVDLQSK
ncbi:MAG: hypothetical protein KKG33_02955 [candidate division Zixibacteria bacterium]|nr:hypothetical protein [candidate division Zixibacteria bacterium]MBU1470739.1 hypothetical protein [candidate division Zixibacteria bacterium]MBU2624501.1 hypothetical protein [candidate division Zixibacteria bacterium]